MTLTITLSNMELGFKDVFLRLIKPFNLVIGHRDLIIAYGVFDKFKRSHSEVVDVLKNDYDITVVFRNNVPVKKRKQLLLSVVDKLRRAYVKELGVVAERMIDFAVGDLLKKL